MNIKKIIGISTVAAAGAAVGAAVMKKYQDKSYTELIDKIGELISDTLENDSGVLDIAEAEHKNYTEVSRKYKQLCKEYDELQNEYNDMLDYYDGDND